MSSSPRPTDRDAHVAATTESRDGTLGALRELTADLPDDTPIGVWIRKAEDEDDFYERAPVEFEAVDLGRPVTVELTVSQPVGE